MEYMTLKEASQIWKISPRMINYYCSAGRIPGAEKMGTVWLIPKNATKPLDGRKNLPGNQEENIMIEVYYAEDDESIAKSVKEYLEQQDCKVVVFGGIADLRKALIGHSAFCSFAGLEYAGWRGERILPVDPGTMEGLACYLSDSSW